MLQLETPLRSSHAGVVRRAEVRVRQPPPPEHLRLRARTEAPHRHRGPCIPAPPPPLSALRDASAGGLYMPGWSGTIGFTSMFGARYMYLLDAQLAVLRESGV